MDADTDCILSAVEKAPAVDTPAALLERDVIILRNQELCIIASVLQIRNYASGDLQNSNIIPRVSRMLTFLIDLIVVQTKSNIVSFPYEIFFVT